MIKIMFEHIKLDIVDRPKNQYLYTFSLLSENTKGEYEYETHGAFTSNRDDLDGIYPTDFVDVDMGVSILNQLGFEFNPMKDSLSINKETRVSLSHFDIDTTLVLNCYNHISND